MDTRLAGLRILVVDDTAELRYVLYRWLSAPGADVVTASSAREAIALACEYTPRLALVDLFMPGEGGLVVLTWLRTLEKELGIEMTIAAITSYHGAEARDVALRAGFDAFIERPTESEPLVDELRRVIGSDALAPHRTIE